MKADVRTTWRLLRPLAREHLLGFALVFLFGALAALGERSVYLVLTPTFEALFGKAEETQSVEPPVLEEPELEVAFEWLQTLREGAHEAFEEIQVARDELTVYLLGSAHPETDAERMDVLWHVGLLVLYIAIFSGLFQYLFSWVSRRIALLMVVDLRMRIARHLMRLSMRYHDSRELGDVLSRISADVGTTLAVLTDAFRNLLLEPLKGLAALTLAFVVAPMATLGMLLGLPLVLLPVTVMSRKVRKGSTKSLTKLGASIQMLSQMFQGIRTVKAFRAEERELENFRRVNAEYVHESMRMVRAIAITQSWTIVFTHVGLGSLIILVGWLTMNGATTFSTGGDMVAFFVLIANVYTNVKKTTRMWTRVQESVGASSRLQELLDIPEDIVESEGARILKGIGAGLRLECVSFGYPGTNSLALRDIELELRPGETLALVGASGGGKSTLIDIIARFRDPTAGRVAVDGNDLRELTFDSWSDHYAMVGQTPFLFHATVEQNIGYGKPGASEEEIHAAARAADIHDFIMGLPEAYQTDVADMGARLSGGQRQRITIARAILKGAPLLLLDEATSALDSETEIKVQAALDVLCAGRTVIVIAHRLSTIRRADRIAVMEEGRVVELGTHDELLGMQGSYARLHRAQFQEA